MDAEEGSDYSFLKNLVGCITCSASDCLPTEFIHFDDENWESEFFDKLATDRNASDDRDMDKQDVDNVDEQLCVLKLKSFANVLKSLEDAQIYLTYRGYANMAMDIGVLMNKLSTVSIVSTKQTTIDDYFQT